MRKRSPQMIVESYLSLGLALGRHVEGLVDAYYGPPALAAEAAAGAPAPAGLLADRADRLLSEVDACAELGPGRRTWLTAQLRGLRTSARRLAGHRVGYLEEIEACYGVRPSYLPEESLAEAHRRLDAVLPGSGSLEARYMTWKEAQAVPPELLARAVSSLAEDFRARTLGSFGLPEGEQVDFELVSAKPWSGFNYYLGGFRSRVAINTDLPVLSPGLAGLVAHESYPGHHTEHCRKESGLVRGRGQLEETIFLVGTPQCLIAEGLADLGLEVVAGPRPEGLVAEHLRPLGVPYDPGVAAEVASAGEVIAAARGNAAILLHDRRRSEDEVVAYLERWAVLPRARAVKAVQFLTDPTWRAYVFCYIDGVRLCRGWVAADPSRFERLLDEQLVPAQLAAGPADP